jgi:hypothetical protein
MRYFPLFSHEWVFLPSLYVMFAALSREMLVAACDEAIGDGERRGFFP